MSSDSSSSIGTLFKLPVFLSAPNHRLTPQKTKIQASLCRFSLLAPLFEPIRRGLPFGTLSPQFKLDQLRPYLLRAARRCNASRQQPSSLRAFGIPELQQQRLPPCQLRVCDDMCKFPKHFLSPNSCEAASGTAIS